MDAGVDSSDDQVRSKHVVLHAVVLHNVDCTPCIVNRSPIVDAICPPNAAGVRPDQRKQFMQ